MSPQPLSGRPGSKERKMSAETLDEPENSRPAKRARVAVACTRCKTRKQKCDGCQPKCGNCKNISTSCEYIVPSKTMPYGKYQYVKALESRVAELELMLRNAGLIDPDEIQWVKLQQSDVSNEPNLRVHNQEGRWTDDRQPVSPATSDSSSMRQPAPGAAHAAQRLNDLSLQAGGGHFGNQSSKIIVGNMFRSFVQGREPPHSSLTSCTRVSPNFSSDDTELPSEIAPLHNELGTIMPEMAEKLLKAYLKNISTRWVAVYRPQIIELHKNRAKLTDPFDISTLNLVYAIGGRFLETVGEVGVYFPERHYLAAIAHLDVILQAHDLSSVQTLLLHAIYCLRVPRGLSAWTNVGLAIRICIELGMHRQLSSEHSSLTMEVRKRIFWTCYCLDRQVSIILGRPFAISDRDIDLELPLDVDDSMTDIEIRSFSATKSDELSSSTSLSCFIHLTRLRRIESRIQQSMYRVDKSSPLPMPIIERFLVSLTTWKEQIPAKFSKHDTETYSYEGDDYFMVYYYKTLRLLLYPNIISQDVDVGILRQCAAACGGVCRTYKNLHRKTTVGFSLMALYSVFLSGLTLLYCLWISPSEIYSISASNDLNACSIILYVIAERWPGANKYRDAFESIRQNILDIIAENKGQKRVPLKGLKENKELQDIVQGIKGLHPEGRAEFSNMMSEMVGETPLPFTLQTASSTTSDLQQQHQFRETTKSSDQIPVAGNQMVFGESIEVLAFQNLNCAGMNVGVGDMSFGAIELLDEFDMGDFLGIDGLDGLDENSI